MTQNKSTGRYSIKVEPGIHKKGWREIEGFWALAYDNEEPNEILRGVGLIDDTHVFGRTESIAADLCMNKLRTYVAARAEVEQYPREVWRGDL